MAPSLQLARPRLDPFGLIWTLVRTEFKVRYHRTVLGFFWALLRPTAMVVVLASVFSFLFADQPHYRLELLVGMFLWDFFADSTKTGLISLHAKAYLLTKTPFPRWVMVVTSFSNAIITLVVVCTATVVILWAVGRPVTPLTVSLFACYVLCLVVMVVGISLGTSVLFLRYRDLNQVWEVAIHAGFFLSPVVYPMGAIPERYHFLLYLWPPTPVIQFSRAVLIDGVPPTLKAHLLLLLETLVVLGIGIEMFRRHAPKIAERL